MDSVLLSQIVSNIEPNLAIDLLQKFVADGLLDASKIEAAKLRLLLKTQRYQETIEAINKMSSLIPKDVSVKLLADIQVKQNELKESLPALQEAASLLLEANEKSFDDIKANNFNRTYVLTNPTLKQLSLNTQRILDSITYAKYIYETGDIALSNRLVSLLYPIAETNETINSLSWAKLFSTLRLSLSGALVEAKDLKSTLRIVQYTIEQKPLDSLISNLTNRSMLFLMMVISFLVIDNKSGLDYDFLMEILTQETYLVSLSIDNPSFFRYVVVIFALCHNNTRFSNFRSENLLRIISQINTEYSDSYIKFVTRLYKEYDFDGTLACIKEIKIEAEKDILTSNKSSLIVNTLYTLLFETYCAIYSAVEISKVSEWVELNEEESEIWIVNLARKNNLNAKLTVNSTGEKVMTFKAATDKSKKEILCTTKNLFSRTELLSNNLDKMLKLSQQLINPVLNLYQNRLQKNGLVQLEKYLYKEFSLV